MLRFMFRFRGGGWGRGGDVAFALALLLKKNELWRYQEKRCFKSEKQCGWE